MSLRHASPLIVVLTLLTPLGAQQQPAADNAHRYISAVGEATVTLKPDQATIEIAVVTQSTNAGAAAAQNSKQTDAVLEDLRKVLGSAGEIKTNGYSLTPNYQYAKLGEPGTIVGYTANNVVQVTSNDLSLLGKLIDAATQSGANRIQNLQFKLKNDRSARAQALREAATQARVQAEAIAAGLGVKLVRVLSADGGAAPGRPVRMFAAATPATPVETGNINVTASVTLRMEVQ